MSDPGSSGPGSRRRAIAFGVFAMIAAGISASLANGYGSSVAEGYGPLRTVVVAQTSLESGEVIGPDLLESALRTRRVPARFAPPGTLSQPGQALGLEPGSDIAAGSYLLSSQLAPPKRARPRSSVLGRGRRPVEIAVTGAGALLAAGAPLSGARVDIVVTTEPRASGPGHTYVAASRVPLLGLTPGEGPGPTATSAATLAVTRRQALELIEAENFARQVRLLPLVAP